MRILYTGLSPRIRTRLAYLCETDLAALEPGDYEIDGEPIYARALTYTTRGRRRKGYGRRIAATSICRYMVEARNASAMRR